MDDAMTGVSWLRVTLLTIGFLSLLPLTLFFGLFGLLAGMMFVILAAMAK